MTTREIKRQINMQKIHNARTKRAKNNLAEGEKLFARYGGMYTQAEINLHEDLHPYFKDITYSPRPVDEDVPSEKEIMELLNQLDMYTRCVQEDNYLMA